MHSGPGGVVFQIPGAGGQYSIFNTEGDTQGGNKEGKEKPRQKVEVRKWTVIEAKQIIVISLTKISNTPWQNMKVTKRNSRP